MRDSIDSGAFSGHDVTVTLISDSRMRAMNAIRRNVARPTDVLSFPIMNPREAAFDENGLPNYPQPYGDHAGMSNALEAPKGAATFNPLHSVLDLGDIYIDVDYCARDARLLGQTAQEYIPVLAAHGLAHLCGFVHDTPESYAAMKEAEEKMLSTLESPESRPVRAEGFPDKEIKSYLR